MNNSQKRLTNSHSEGPSSRWCTARWGCSLAALVVAAVLGVLVMATWDRVIAFEMGHELVRIRSVVHASELPSDIEESLISAIEEARAGLREGLIPDSLVWFGVESSSRDIIADGAVTVSESGALLRDIEALGDSQRALVGKEGQ